MNRALRQVLLSLPGGLGLGTLLTHLLYRPSAGLEGAAAAVTATVTGEGWLLACLGAWVALVAITGRLTATAALRWCLALRVGSALPILSPLLELWSWRCAAPELALLGGGVALAVAALDPVERGERSPSRGSGPSVPWMAALLAVVAGAFLLIVWPEPGGDEPHYLLVARSLWEDGSFDVADEYAAGDYEPFWKGPLAPHAKPGAAEGSRYSTHGFGYPLLLTPAMAAGRERAVTAARWLQIGWFGLFAAGLATLLGQVADRRAALAGTAGTVLLAPVLFSSVALFPETPAMALSCWAYLLLRRRGSGHRAWTGGILLALLPWIAMKLMPVSIAIAAVAVLRHSGPARRRTAVAVVAPLALSLLAHAGWTWSLYGTVSPLAIYVGAEPELGRHTSFGTDWRAYLTEWPGALASSIGYLLDQKEGLLAVGPHFLLAAAGAGWLWRRLRGEALALAAVFLAHLVPYALAQELGGQSIPVRPLLPVLWTLSVPLGIALSSPGDRFRACLTGGVLALSGTLTVNWMLHPGLLTHDYSVRMSRTLLAMSPRGTELWEAFPLWLNVERAWTGANLAWLVVLVLVTIWLFRDPRETDRSGSARAGGILGATAVTTVVLASASLVVDRLPLTDSHRGAPMLEGLHGWRAQFYPELGWVEESVLWARPGRARTFVLEATEPREDLRLAVRSLVATDVVLRIGNARHQLRLRAGETERIDLEPGPGRSAQGRRWWLVHLRASHGGRPALLTGGEDYRLLGAGVRFVRAGGPEPGGRP